MNTQNVVILTGRIPQTDKIKYEFTSGEDVNKNRLKWLRVSAQSLQEER